MNTRCRWWMVVLLMLALPATGWTSKVPAAGDRLISIKLNSPAEAGKRSYLGLSDTGTFAPTEITGKLLLIEIFSMYCPYCQKEAPVVNRLYEAIEASEELRGQVKMIGIGVGNSEFEVNHFRKHYQIAFPLFPDEDFTIHQAIGEVRTPFFIICTIGSADAGNILWTGSGKLEPLKTITERLNGLLKQR